MRRTPKRRLHLRGYQFRYPFKTVGTFLERRGCIDESKIDGEAQGAIFCGDEQDWASLF